MENSQCVGIFHTNCCLSLGDDLFLPPPNVVCEGAMFLQVFVCPQGGGGCASVHAGIPPWIRHTPHHQEQTHAPRSRHPREPPRAAPLPEHDPPPEQTPPTAEHVGDTVNARAVRILLECNLVPFWKSSWIYQSVTNTYCAKRSYLQLLPVAYY